MKKLAIAAALMATVSPAFATDADWMAFRPGSPQQFAQAYEYLVGEAGQHGVPMNHVCFPTYCANQMIWVDRNASLLLQNVFGQDGATTQGFCYTPGDPRGINRRCWESDGRILDETYNGHSWDTSGTVTATYPN